MNACLDEPRALQLRRLLETGLPLAARPYRQLAEQIGCSEQQVLEQVEQWQQVGLFRRVGLVLKHRALGFRANAMLVMDIPDEHVDEVGRRLGQPPASISVTSDRGACPTGPTTCSAWCMGASANRSAS